MFVRYLSSATVGIAVTVGLLYIMHFLISIAPGADPGARSGTPIVLTRVKVREDTPVEHQKPEPIPEPEPAPRQTNRESLTTESVGVPVIPPEPPVEPGFEGFGDSFYSDGPLVAVYKVQPAYPAAPLRRGLEGWVIVQYDVLASGTVANVMVLESSSGVFEKAAVEATYRFRFKPRVVDGVAQMTTGLRDRFVFELRD